MPYTADVSRSNPACFLFLIDQSRSMNYAFAGRPGELKMDQAAAAVNRILGAVCKRCSRGSDVRNYFDIGVIGYRTDERGEPIIRSVLPGTFPDQPFLPIDQVFDVADVDERRVREGDGDGGLVEVTRRTPVWLHPPSVTLPSGEGPERASRGECWPSRSSGYGPFFNFLEVKVAVGFRWDS